VGAKNSLSAASVEWNESGIAQTPAMKMGACRVPPWTNSMSGGRIGYQFETKRNTVESRDGLHAIVTKAGADPGRPKLRV
jgi:hypothetical protein